MGAVATIIWTTVAGYFAEKGVRSAINYVSKNPTKTIAGVTGSTIGYQVSKNEGYIDLAIIAACGGFLFYYLSKKKGK